jgi:hypothetical protein
LAGGNACATELICQFQFLVSILFLETMTRLVMLSGASVSACQYRLLNDALRYTKSTSSGWQTAEGQDPEYCHKVIDVWMIRSIR